jgi:hypothetical protein
MSDMANHLAAMVTGTGRRAEDSSRGRVIR